MRLLCVESNLTHKSRTLPLSGAGHRWCVFLVDSIPFFTVLFFHSFSLSMDFFSSFSLSLPGVISATSYSTSALPPGLQHNTTLFCKDEKKTKKPSFILFSLTESEIQLFVQLSRNATHVATRLAGPRHHHFRSILRVSSTLLETILSRNSLRPCRSKAPAP